jgi:hypothetical protein
LTTEQVEQVMRTVRRTPEVVVKVSGGARESAGARAHFDYIDRHGKLAIELDDGRTLEGRRAGAALVDEWNLDLCRGQYRPKPDGVDTRPKLVHNIVLSMPGPTPPGAVLAAARRFAREQFALQYRYAMVLHTDQGHPHVHLVVKAEHEYEPAKRLTIRKETLRRWRECFAECLRAEGVAANATPAALRGRGRNTKKDPIHQRLRSLARYAAMPADARPPEPPAPSSFMRTKVERIARDLQRGHLPSDEGHSILAGTRREVDADWQATAMMLRRNGMEALAAEVDYFVASLPPVRTEAMQIAANLIENIRAQRRAERLPDPPDR